MSTLIAYFIFFTLPSFASVDFDMYERQINLSVNDLPHVYQSMLSMNKHAKTLLSSRDRIDNTTLKIGTYNTGMLYAFGVAVPKYKKRVQYLIPEIKIRNFDVLFLQEIFNNWEQKQLKIYAQLFGYHFYNGTKKYFKHHGLVILIKKEIFSEILDSQEILYDDQVFYEVNTGYEKSYLRIRLRLQHGKTITLLNTHLSALSFMGHIRKDQVKQLIKQNKNYSTDYFIFGGDINSLPTSEENVYKPLITAFSALDIFRATKNKKIPGYTWDYFNNNLAAVHIVGSSKSKRYDFTLISRKDQSLYYYVKNSYLDFTYPLPIDACSVSISKELRCSVNTHFTLL